MLLWITQALVIVFDLAFRHTRFLRQVYFIGANDKAARRSGISAVHVRIVLYALTGMLAALAGVSPYERRADRWQRALVAVAGRGGHQRRQSER